MQTAADSVISDQSKSFELVSQHGGVAADQTQYYASA